MRYFQIPVGERGDSRVRNVMCYIAVLWKKGVFSPFLLGKNGERSS